MFEDKTIAVIGGTGTIGSLIVEYLLTQKTRVIRVITNSENESVQKEWEWGINGLRYPIADIRDAKRMKRVLRGCDYVFNCAAMKHVYKCEYDPDESFKTNVNGLENVIEACIKNKVKKLLHISTDKAVEPTTVMGATKFLGERILQMRWAQNHTVNPDVDMVCIRSGNVYGSRGSFVEIIRNVIKNNESTLFITDKNMCRFFIEKEELVKLIMTAFEKGKHGEIWVPKLKEVNIMDVVKREGFKGSVDVIGNGRGEKLHEKLLSDAEILTADHTHKDYWIVPNSWRRIV
jgi:UDP-glucose 4-epimerase